MDEHAKMNGPYYTQDERSISFKALPVDFHSKWPLSFDIENLAAFSRRTITRLRLRVQKLQISICEDSRKSVMQIRISWCLNSAYEMYSNKTDYRTGMEQHLESLYTVRNTYGLILSYRDSQCEFHTLRILKNMF